MFFFQNQDSLRPNWSLVTCIQCELVIIACLQLLKRLKAWRKDWMMSPVYWPIQHWLLCIPGITFDQPVLLKAYSIARHWHRLSPFHTLIEFSRLHCWSDGRRGIKEFLWQIYGPETVMHVLNGKVLNGKACLFSEEAFSDSVCSCMQAPVICSGSGVYVAKSPIESVSSEAMVHMQVLLNAFWVMKFMVFVRALHEPKISSPAQLGPKKIRPGTLHKNTGPAQWLKSPAWPGLILFLDLLLTQTKTQFCDLHVKYT